MQMCITVCARRRQRRTWRTRTSSILELTLSIVIFAIASGGGAAFYAAFHAEQCCWTKGPHNVAREALPGATALATATGWFSRGFSYKALQSDIEPSP